MKPSRSQLQILHLVADGSLTFHSWPRARFEVRVTGGVDQSWQFHEATAKILIEREWVSMRSMRPGAADAVAEYQITDLGRELISEYCSRWVRYLNSGVYHSTHIPETNHKRWCDQDNSEKLAGKLLCRDCGRLVPCTSKRTAQHPAVEWDWKFGPVCKYHLDWILTDRYSIRSTA